MGLGSDTIQIKVVLVKVDDTTKNATNLEEEAFV